MTPLPPQAAADATPDPGGPTPPAPEAVVWHVAGGLRRPEGACYDDTTKAVYVSNAGPDGEGDGAGYLTKLAPDGRVLAADWVTGLTAPRGLRGAKGKLYVGCGDHLVVIDAATAAIAARVLVPGADRLTGVTVDAAGVVYLSDPPAGRIYTWDGTTTAVFAEGDDLEHPNGLLAMGNQLFVAGWGNPGAEPGVWVPGRVYALNLKTKAMTLVTPNPVGHLGGLERDDKFNFLVTDRAAGKVYRVSPRGEATLLLAGIPGPAGHGFVPEKRLLVLPRTTQDCVTAYDLAKLAR